VVSAATSASNVWGRRADPSQCGRELRRVGVLDDAGVRQDERPAAAFERRAAAGENGQHSESDTKADRREAPRGSR